MSEQPKRPGPDLDRLIQQCKDAPGFVLFVGVLTPDKNKDGNQQIQFYYTRQKFCLEDVGKAVKAFKQHFIRDLEQ